MGNIYRTAAGNSVDIDRIRLANETTISVGNTKTNARGDQLGAGGKIIKTRAQIMAEYHQVNTGLADHNSGMNFDDEFDPTPSPVVQPTAPASPPSKIANAKTAAQDTPVTAPVYNKPRGNFADSIAKETEVNQELVEPISLKNKTSGPQRI